MELQMAILEVLEGEVVGPRRMVNKDNAAIGISFGTWRIEH
jgi:hypothetical protein